MGKRCPTQWFLGMPRPPVAALEARMATKGCPRSRASLWIACLPWQDPWRRIGQVPTGPITDAYCWGMGVVACLLNGPGV